MMLPPRPAGQQLPFTPPAWLNVPRKGAQGRTNDQLQPGTRRTMKERYVYIMQEVDKECGHFIAGIEEPFQFLDVCCAPGGFSEYTLAANPNARGVGLSLNVELGGHLPSLETYDHATNRMLDVCPLVDATRYHMHFVDVTTVSHKVVLTDIGCQLPEKALALDRAALLHPASSRNLCQLMILDGSVLGGKANIAMAVDFKGDWENPTYNCYASALAANQALIAAQIQIMVNNLKDGGTVVLRASMTWSDFTYGMLALLRRMFRGTIQSYKPRTCHQDAISYYLVCREFDLHTARGLEVGTNFGNLVMHMRNGRPPPQLVPFPQFPEGRSPEELKAFWGLALQVFHLPLWIFRGLVRMAKDPQTRIPRALLEAAVTQHLQAMPCWRMLVYEGTTSACSAAVGTCPAGAHGVADLHPFSYLAFQQVHSLLHMPDMDGTLKDGQQHPRNEEIVVFSVLSDWFDKLYTQQYGVVNPLHPTAQLERTAWVERHSMQLGAQLWPEVVVLGRNNLMLSTESTMLRLQNQRRLSPMQQALAQGFTCLEVRILWGLPLHLPPSSQSNPLAAGQAQAKQLAALRQQQLLLQQAQRASLPAAAGAAVWWDTSSGPLSSSSRPGTAASGRAGEPGAVAAAEGAADDVAEAAGGPTKRQRTGLGASARFVAPDPYTDVWLLSMVGDTLGEDEWREEALGAADAASAALFDSELVAGPGSAGKVGAPGAADGGMAGAQEGAGKAPTVALSGYRIPMSTVVTADEASRQALLEFLGCQGHAEEALRAAHQGESALRS